MEEKNHMIKEIPEGSKIGLGRSVQEILGERKEEIKKDVLEGVDRLELVRSGESAKNNRFRYTARECYSLEISFGEDSPLKFSSV